MESKTLRRRNPSSEVKAEVLAACEQPDASVAAIALTHGPNANLLHKWRRLAARPGGGSHWGRRRPDGRWVCRLACGEPCGDGVNTRHPR